MLDIQFIKDHPQEVKKACQNKRTNSALVDQVIDQDKKRRKLIQDIQSLREERNKLTKDKAEEGREIKKQLKVLEPQLRKVKAEFNSLLAQIPNLPANDVSIGKDESENALVKKWGEIPKFSFKIKDHLQLGEELDLVDVQRAAKVSGARFNYLKNQAVLLEFALINYGLEILLKEGFKPVVPPELTRVAVFHKLGYSQQGDSEEYYLVFDPNKEDPQEGKNYYLIGTAEHALVPMHKDEILDPDQLPLRYVGFSSAFRREAGSYGKDTRGILRVHQFDKLEMVSFVKPQKKSDQKEQEYLLSLAEKIVQGLEIPYRLVKMCTGDLGHPTARKFDIECWLPSQEKYRETHSISSCTDYQSRALKIRYRGKDNQTDFVDTLNGTAIAIGRTIIALLENNQQEDGSVKIPKVLQKYLGFKTIIPPKK